MQQSDSGKKSYRNILKSTVVFGSTQISVTIINIVRVKLSAIILGAAGCGLSSLLLNASNCIQQIASLGINFSGVREISQACSEQDKAALHRTARIIRLMMAVCALAGMVGAVFCSPLTARFSLGSTNHLISFAMLGIVVFLNIIATGEYAILQGMQRYKDLAYNSVIPPLCGLMLGIPLYYVMGTKGIVPAMILQALIYCIAMRRTVSRKALGGRPLPHVSLRYTWQRGRRIIMLGVVMMAASLLGVLTTMSLSAFISNVGSIDDVGFYQSASAITTQCSALVFSAMATDYYPRLSGIIDRDRVAAHRMVNQQTEIVLLIIVPIAMLIISLVPLIITVLLTGEFQVMRRMMRLMAYAVVFKGLCFPVDYISYSKGDKRFFFWVEGVFLNLKMLVLFTVFYYYMGLDGLGYAAVVSSLTDVPVSLLLNRWRYGFRLSRPAAAMAVRLTLMATLCLAASFVASAVVSHALMLALTAFCCAYSYRQIDRRIGIRQLLRRKH